MVRVLVTKEDISLAIGILETNNLPYDFDSGDRFLLRDDEAQEAIQLLDENGLDYEII